MSSKLCRLVEGNTQKFSIKYIYKCEKSPARRVRQTMGLALDHFGDAVECDGDIMLLGNDATTTSPGTDGRTDRQSI